MDFVSVCDTSINIKLYTNYVFGGYVLYHTISYYVCIFSGSKNDENPEKIHTICDFIWLFDFWFTNCSSLYNEFWFSSITE